MVAPFGLMDLAPLMRDAGGILLPNMTLLSHGMLFVRDPLDIGVPAQLWVELADEEHYRTG